MINNKLDSLMDYMNGRWHILSPPKAVSKDVSNQAMAQALGAYAKTCSTCHGMDGKGSKSSRDLKPPPPDLAAYSLSPERTFDVISKGYSDTMMPAFSGLPE
uniref:c-type cytochrome n=1 Tax=Dissulfurimicrobium sp. TaxID=2022436 RepID=UPI004049D023